MRTFTAAENKRFELERLTRANALANLTTAEAKLLDMVRNADRGCLYVTDANSESVEVCSLVSSQLIAVGFAFGEYYLEMA